MQEKWLSYLFMFLAGACVYFSVVLGVNISPAYWFLFLPSLVFGIWAYFLYKKAQYNQKVQKLRAMWGQKQIMKERKLEDSAILFNSASEKDGTIDDRTWYDLNLDQVFEQIDRTITWPGQQKMYQMLRTPIRDDLDQLHKRNSMVESFQKNLELREKVQLKLGTMDGRIGSGLASLLWDQLNVEPVHSPLLYKAFFVVALISPILLLIKPSYAILVLLIFQGNMYVHFSVQKKTKSYFEGVRSLGQMIRTAKELAAVESTELDSLLQNIKKTYLQVKDYGKIIKNVGVESVDPTIGVIVQYYSIFFLAEVRGFYKALAFIEQYRSELQELFLAIGELDALQAIASYRESVAYYCAPNFNLNSELELVDAYHPLILEPIANSISSAKKGILITGSNMSGKSTFLRTVGLNVLFSQTICTCLAKSYQACPFQLITSIGRADNVVEGKSYYLEEALGVRRIIDAINNDLVTFAIFDELFRGTNSEERIFAAQQVLEYLIARNSLVFVATHDLELVDLLADTYESVHFSEEVGALGLQFDYKLKKGPATTKNAIALLRYLKYPKEITDPVT